MTDPIMMKLLNCGMLDGPINPSSHAQVSQWVVAMLKGIRVQPPIGPGFTEQATIDGALVAAATLAEDHVRRRLPHKAMEQSVKDAADLFKRLNHVIADYIAEQIKFQGN